MKLFIIILIFLVSCTDDIVVKHIVEKNPPVNIKDLNGWYCVDGRYSFVVFFSNYNYNVNISDIVNYNDPPCTKWDNPFPVNGYACYYDNLEGIIHFYDSDTVSNMYIEVIDNKTMIIKDAGSYNGTARRVQ